MAANRDTTAIRADFFRSLSQNWRDYSTVLIHILSKQMRAMQYSGIAIMFTFKVMF